MSPTFGRGADSPDAISTGSCASDRPFGLYLTKTDEKAITGHVLYAARHTYASTLLARCRDFVYVAAQMGHASPETWVVHYAHLLPGVYQSYANFLDMSEADWQRFSSDGRTAPKKAETI